MKAEKIINWLEDWERLPLAIITMAGPWLTPLVPAYFAFAWRDSSFNIKLVSGLLVYSMMLLVYIIMFVFARRMMAASHFIYLLRRADGVYKVGMTNNVRRRMTELERDYGQGFTLVYRWKTNNAPRSENIALCLTRGSKHVEGNRKELRKMRFGQVLALILSFDFYRSKR